MALFRSFWYGEPLSPYQQLCLKSFVDHGHEFILYCYDHFDVPSGIELRDAAEFFPRDRVFFYRKGLDAGSVAAFSDLFRFRMLHDCGGWWVDADVVCLSPEVPSRDIVFAFEDKSRQSVGSAVLKFPRAHPLTLELCRGAEEAGTDIDSGQIGPHLITQVVRRHSLENLVMEAPAAYPLPPGDALHALIPERCAKVREKTRGATFFHLWNEVLRRSGVLKSIAPPSGSFLADLFQKHGVGFGAGVTYSEDQVQRLHDNFAGYLKKIAADFNIAEHRKEIAYLNEELEKARRETESAILDRDIHREFIQRLSSSTLWRMSGPLRALTKIWEDKKRRS